MLRFLIRIEELALCLLIAGMSVLVFIEVILRFFFSTGIHWALELTEYLNAWMVMFGVSYALKSGSHICVDYFVQKLIEPKKRLAMIVASVICALYGVLFLISSILYTARLYQADIYMYDLPLPVWVGVAGMVCGMITLTIRSLIITYQIYFNTRQSVYIPVNELEKYQ